MAGSSHCTPAWRPGPMNAKLERLCRYISRRRYPKRLSLTRGGNVRYQLKTPYRDGTTHVIFEPLDFIARLAATVPKPRVSLTRFHGVFAPTVGTGRWSRRQNGAGATRSGWLMNRQHQHNGERR